MIKSRNKIVFIVIVIVLIGGLWLLLARPNQTTKDEGNSIPGTNNLVTSQSYASVIKPWLEEVNNNYSLEAIKGIKAKLFELKSSDRFLGEVHMNLFLSFDVWERYFNNLASADKEKIISGLNILGKSYPQLAGEISRLLAKLK